MTVSEALKWTDVWGDYVRGRPDYSMTTDVAALQILAAEVLHLREAGDELAKAAGRLSIKKESLSFGRALDCALRKWEETRTKEEA